MNEHTSAFGRAEISKQAVIGICGITEIGTCKGKHFLQTGYVKHSEVLRYFLVGNCSKNRKSEQTHKKTTKPTTTSSDQDSLPFQRISFISHVFSGVIWKNEFLGWTK